MDIINDNDRAVNTAMLDYLPFIDELVTLQLKLAKKFAKSEYRKTLHESSSAKFSKLHADLQEWAAHVETLEARAKDVSERKSQKNNTKEIQLNLRFEEVQDLPDDLLAELSLNEADKTDYQIRALIDELGGIASLDRLIVGMYRNTGEIIKRSTMTSKLYRMIQKGVVFGVPGWKGVYSTEEMSEEEAATRIEGKKKSD